AAAGGRRHSRGGSGEVLDREARTRGGGRISGVVVRFRRQSMVSVADGGRVPGDSEGRSASRAAHEDAVDGEVDLRHVAVVGCRGSQVDGASHYGGAGRRG